MNGTFDPFWKSLMGQIAVRVQIPPEVLLKKRDESIIADSYDQVSRRMARLIAYVGAGRAARIAAPCRIYGGWLSPMTGDVLRVKEVRRG